ncbi:hypothetical protein [Lysinibacillus sp. JNUCC 51]
MKVLPSFGWLFPSLESSSVASRALSVDSVVLSVVSTILSVA